jgi:Lysylphosphatidylglycerol synthase TM region
LIVALAGERAEFTTALGAASLWILIVATVLQILWLAVRSETWGLCVNGAGGRVTRRRLYPAASIGYLGNLLNGQFGLAVRIAALRRSAPQGSPRASVLAATEVPIVVVEAALAALMSFTLVGPLGLDWWIPPLGLVVTVAAMVCLRQLARDRRDGVWRGLAVLRGVRGRNRIVGLVVVAVCLQIARNWFVLNGVGVDASVLDSVALLIAMSMLGVLPVGPSIGAASAVIVFGADTGAAAAAGALLTATAAVGALWFAASALLGAMRRSPAPAGLASG